VGPFASRLPFSFFAAFFDLINTISGRPNVGADGCFLARAEEIHQKSPQRQYVWAVGVISIKFSHSLKKEAMSTAVLVLGQDGPEPKGKQCGVNQPLIPPENWPQRSD